MSVTIDVNGDFNGFDWGENIGWIDFQNQTVPFKTQTEWTPQAPTVVELISSQFRITLRSHANYSIHSAYDLFYF